MVNSKYLLIKHQNIKKGPKLDTTFYNTCNKKYKKEYKPKYILKNKAYDTPKKIQYLKKQQQYHKYQQKKNQKKQENINR